MPRNNIKNYLNLSQNVKHAECQRLTIHMQVVNWEASTNHGSTNALHVFISVANGCHPTTYNCVLHFILTLVSLVTMQKIHNSSCVAEQGNGMKGRKIARSVCDFMKSTNIVRDSKKISKNGIWDLRILLWTFYLFIFNLALPTRAGSPQQHMPITVGPFCLTHPVNFPCGRKPEYPEETHDFRQSVGFYSFHMRTGFESHWESSHWDLNLRPQRWKASALTTWPPKPL
jgi:hypothetical protein